MQCFVKSNIFDTLAGSFEYSGLIMMYKSSMKFVSALFLSLFLSACSPEIGSKEWCAELKEKPKGDWSMNEAGDYAKHCLLN